MKIVDVLRQGPDAWKMGLHFGDDLMGAIEAGTPGGLFDVAEILPGHFGPAAKHRAGKGVLDGDSILGGLAVVEAANAAIGRQARVGRNAGAGDEKQVGRAPQDFHDAVNCRLVPRACGSGFVHPK